MKKTLLTALLFCFAPYLPVHAAEPASGKSPNTSLAQEISNEEAALKVLRDKAEQGDKEAQTQLTRKLLRSSWPLYRTEGIERLKIEADANDAPAQFLLAKAYLNQRNGDHYDPKSGVAYLKKSAESGFAPAQLLLSVVLAKHTELQRDYVQSAEWAKKVLNNPQADEQLTSGANKMLAFIEDEQKKK
ncbi:tetratricopeptide repeat protein [Pectobacterium brasiliense]|uniref:tetratricopeptide repeat protein n=1 Tax=Pectobacterium brasiliense TaxID=180957 RepID=UPI00094A7F8D|nr:sel1 repeat family protein [Pectobacterium brasiliense]APS28472.1 hypothetical protein NC16_01500 [Pectobacterium brasiliense]MBN3097014.1 sel1 repeat family protein [Pectobacterium brasiliense]MBN3103428.1 sel1 repeat family protein [Pectobacterium brasiliense]MBN3166140.1 sel1 repeat family protein [Pectobacterium brasiliense]MBN3183266.1 sel1 repeat family protein [Pectobacterium brasiliense]